jgi:hypothetical protein
MLMPEEYQPTSAADSVPTAVPNYAPELLVSTAVSANAAHVDAYTWIRVPVAVTHADKSVTGKRDWSSLPSNGDNNAMVGVISASVRAAEIYIRASIEGKPVLCLQYTGCECV